MLMGPAGSKTSPGQTEPTMTTTDTKSTTICLKCDGTGNISAFRHIHNGRCFVCGGTGVAPAGLPAGVKVAAPATAHRAVTLGALGVAFIERHAAAYGTAFVAHLGRGACWFNVTGGKIADLVVSDGLRAQRAQVQAALQGALRA